MIRRVMVATAAAALVLSGCSGNAPAAAPASVSGQASAGPSLLDLRTAAGIGACPASDLGATATGTGLPATLFDCLGGDSKVNLAGLPKGEPIVLNFWAQWCGPCRQEGPILGQVYAKAKGRVRMLGVMEVDPEPGSAIALAKQDGMLYPMMVDPDGKARTALRVTALPQTIFIDAHGVVVKRVVAAFDSPQQLEATIQQTFGVTLG